MREDIERVLVDRAAIATRVSELGEQISEDLLADTGGDEPDLVIVPVLTGSLIFVADLIRCIPLRMRIKVVSVSSYPGAATASVGPERMTATLGSLPDRLEGRHVLVVDDILDSGQTLRFVREELLKRGPASFHSCVLLRKRRPEAMATPVDYVAFDIPDEFVVGYGLDYDDEYRNLPEVCTLRAEVVAGAASGEAAT
ncbi:MAG: hypoxanthine phosphoribosyltransferase [Planctomycetota bacterium]